MVNAIPGFHSFGERDCFRHVDVGILYSTLSFVHGMTHTSPVLPTKERSFYLEASPLTQSGLVALEAAVMPTAPPLSGEKLCTHSVARATPAW